MGRGGLPSPRDLGVAGQAGLSRSVAGRWEEPEGPISAFQGLMGSPKWHRGGPSLVDAGERGGERVEKSNHQNPGRSAPIVRNDRPGFFDVVLSPDTTSTTRPPSSPCNRTPGPIRPAVISPGSVIKPATKPPRRPSADERKGQTDGGLASPRGTREYRSPTLQTNNSGFRCTLPSRWVDGRKAQASCSPGDLHRWPGHPARQTKKPLKPEPTGSLYIDPERAAVCPKLTERCRETSGRCPRIFHSLSLMHH
jgi:hypothetical protein